MFKRILSALFIGLILTMTLTTYSSARQAQQVREDVLRLHVLANSDSEADQALKLKVRDGVLDKARALFAEAGDRDAAYAIAARNTAALQQAALQIIAEEGYDYPVVVTVGEQFFPTQAYEGGIRLPAGYYDAVRIEIGAAEGKNWWCVLYPPLCFSGSVAGNDEIMEDVLDANEMEFVSSGARPQVEVKFKLAEWWGLLMEKLGAK